MAQSKSRAKSTSQEYLDSFESCLAAPKIAGQLAQIFNQSAYSFSQGIEMMKRTIRSSAAPFNAAPNLLLCTHESLLGAMAQVFALGLKPMPEFGHVHLVPFLHRDQLICQLIIGYRGLLELAWRSSVVSDVRTGVVHQNDYFRCRFGLVPQLEHVPHNMIEFDDAARGALGHAAATGPGAIVAAYCVVSMKDGPTEFQVVTDVKSVRAVRWNWKQWEDQIWAKEAILYTLKCGPLSLEDHLVKALEVDGCRFIDIDRVVDAGTAVADPAPKNGKGAPPEARNNTNDAPEVADDIGETDEPTGDVDHAPAPDGAQPSATTETSTHDATPEPPVTTPSTAAAAGDTPPGDAQPRPRRRRNAPRTEPKT